MDAGFPQRLKQARMAAGLSLAEAERRAKVGTGTIGRYERAENDPSSQTLLQMALVYRASPTWLLTGQGLMPWTPGKAAKADQQRIVQTLRLLMDYLERESAEGRYVAEALNVEQGAIEAGELAGGDTRASRPDAASG